ncbi:MAG: permease, partial [Candidatus Omnitrophica bacterium]|nr:permease [Candidatus Omnitrophota bacterium]
LGAAVAGLLWGWMLAGIAIGSLMHNYVPQEAIHSLVQKTGWLGVPLATLLGIPLYGGCATILPMAVVLFQKGMPMGTVLALMMSVAALSFPEAVMLRRAMRLPLILIFFGVTGLAIMLTGYLFNAVALLLALSR